MSGVRGHDPLVVPIPTPAPAPFAGSDPAAWTAAVLAALTPAFQRVRDAAPALPAGTAVILVGPGWDAARAGDTAAAAVGGATVALMKTLARDLGPRGLTVNLVAPGDASPAAVERAVAYLASPDAGTVTGQVLTLGRGGPLRP